MKWKKTVGHRKRKWVPGREREVIVGIRADGLTERDVGELLKQQLANGIGSRMNGNFSKFGNFYWCKRWDFQINFSVSLLFLIQKFSFSNWLLREWWNEKTKNWRIKYTCFMSSESTKHSSFNKISCLKNLNLSSILAPVFYLKFYHYIYGTWISLRSKFHIF